MPYTQNEIKHRDLIIQSQKLFWSFLDSNMINKLVNLFDDTVQTPDKISKYVDNERRLRGLDNAQVIGKVYYDDKLKPNFLLELIKNNERFLHISFHLSPELLNPKETGAIHFRKNIYKQRKNIVKKKKYALISVEKPINKPNSLKFRIADGYNTPGIIADITEIKLQEEMDIIINVINRVFDENDPYYIGVKDDVILINLRVDNILNNINKNPLIAVKNKGVRMIGKITKNIPAVPVFYNKYHKTPKGRARSPKARNVTKKIVPANKPKID